MSNMMGGSCMMSQGMMGKGMMGKGMMGGGQSGMDAMIDARLANLKGKLKITDAQTDAWSGYAEAVKGQVDVMPRHDGGDAKGRRD